MSCALRKSTPLLSMLAVIGLVACDQNAVRPQQGKQGPDGVKAFQVRGVVKAVKPAVSSVVVAHEEIVGYMDAMTMEFQAADPKELEGLDRGDLIAFRLNVTDRKGWIDQVKREGISALPPEAPISSSNATPDDKRTPESLPDTHLIDQDNRPFRLGDLRDQVIGVTFIFTRCPYPDFCPRMAQNLNSVQKELASGSQHNWKLICISIDPVYDTPERLSAYARLHSANDSRWLFATGEPQEIEKLSGAFGVAMKREGEELNHTLRTVVADREGRVRKVFTGNTWTTGELAMEMKRALAESKK